MDAVIKPNETIVWDEFYLPTVGLSQITEATRDAAVHLNVESVDGNTLRFHAAVFSTRPGQRLKAILTLRGSKTIHLTEETFVADPKSPARLKTDFPMGDIPDGEYKYHLKLLSDAGDILLEAGIPFTR